MLTGTKKDAIAIGAQILLAEGYAAFIRWVEANKAAHEAKINDEAQRASNSTFGGN